MASVKSYTIELTFKLLALGVVTALLSAYLVENPSIPGASVIVVVLLGTVGSIYALLSTVDALIQESVAQQKLK